MSEKITVLYCVMHESGKWMELSAHCCFWHTVLCGWIAELDLPFPNSDDP